MHKGNKTIQRLTQQDIKRSIVNINLTMDLVFTLMISKGLPEFLNAFCRVCLGILAKHMPKHFMEYCLLNSYVYSSSA